MVVANSVLAQQIVCAIQSVIGTESEALHEPCFSGNELIYLKECVDSTYVSSVGKFVDRFESELASYTGIQHVVAVMNGTSALQIALELAGVKRGDEVLVPALTFIATANAISYCGAVPHFIDSEERTLGADPHALREYLTTISEIRNGQCINSITGSIIRAVLPVHVFGHPVDMDGMLAVARDFHLELIEDAAESLGSTYKGQHTGAFGLLGTLSFNGNKTITTGGGGAILTSDADLARRAKHLTTTAKVPHQWDYVHDEIGYNYRLPNINAALGCAQLEQLPGFIEGKRKLFHRYTEAFENVPQSRIFCEPEGCSSNYWLQTLVLNESAANQKESILAMTNDAGMQTRPAWKLMHKLVPYQNCPKMDLSVAESLEKRLINLPSSSKLGEEGIR